MKPPIEVAIALVWRAELLLVTRRPEGTHLGGHWEFPGGKLKPGETAESCAEREVLEEVALRVHARARRQKIEHSYPERRVVLHPVDCDFQGGALRLLEVSDARWVPRHGLLALTFPAANRSLIAELVASPQAGDRARPDAAPPNITSLLAEPLCLGPTRPR